MTEGTNGANHDEGVTYQAYGIEPNDLTWTCPNCKEQHTIPGIAITFRGEWLELLEALAARRKQNIEQFIVHLLWLESGLRKELRQKAARVFYGHPHEH
jgi:hypothetical protein